MTSNDLEWPFKRTKTKCVADALFALRSWASCCYCSLWW